MLEENFFTEENFYDYCLEVVTFCHMFVFSTMPFFNV